MFVVALEVNWLFSVDTDGVWFGPIFQPWNDCVHSYVGVYFVVFPSWVVLNWLLPFLAFRRFDTVEQVASECLALEEFVLMPHWVLPPFSMELGQCCEGPGHLFFSFGCRVASVGCPLYKSGQSACVLVAIL